MMEDESTIQTKIIIKKIENGELISFEEISLLTSKANLLKGQLITLVYSIKKDKGFPDINRWLFMHLLELSIKSIDNSYHDIFFKNYNKNKPLLKSIISRCISDLNDAIRYFETNVRNHEDIKASDKLFNIIEGIYKLSISNILRFINEFKDLIPDYEIKLPEGISFDDINSKSNEIEIKSYIDKRISQYAPTNNERLKALTEFCPELIKRLLNLSKDEKGQVISLITGVNKDDAYKKVMTADRKIIESTIIQNDEIDIQDLKNKLNNT